MSASAVNPQPPPRSASITNSHILAWDASAVASWLVSCGFSGYNHKFIENDISGDVIVHLNDSFLQEMGIDKVGVRIAILKSIYSLKRLHNIPIELGDFVPLVDSSDNTPNPDSKKTNNQALNDLVFSPEQYLDPRRLSDTLRYHADHLQRLSIEVSHLTADIQRLRDETNTKPSSSRTIIKKSPTLFTRSLGLSSSSSTTTTSLDRSLLPSGSTSTWSPAPLPGVALPPTTDDAFGTLKVYGDRLLSRQHDGYKSFKVHRDDTCSMFLPIVLRKYKIIDDWSQYALFIVPGSGVDRCLGHDEFPFRVYTEHFVTAPASPEPYFVLRHMKQVADMNKEFVVGSPVHPHTAVYATKESAAQQYSRSRSNLNFSGSSTLNHHGTLITPPPLPSFESSTLSPPPHSAPPGTISKSSPNRVPGGSKPQQMSPPSAGVRGPISPPIATITSPPQKLSPTMTMRSVSSSEDHQPPEPVTTPTELSPVATNEPVDAVAVYEYVAQRSDELSLIIGDCVTIESRSSGWCVVSKSDESGWVPAGCLVDENMAEEYATGTRGRVLFDYEKIGPNELSIKKGDWLKLVKGYQHWLLVEDSGSVKGWVPSCFVSIKSRQYSSADRDKSRNLSLDSGRSPVPKPAASHVPNASINSTYATTAAAAQMTQGIPPRSALSISMSRSANRNQDSTAMSGQPSRSSSSSSASHDRRIETAIQDLMEVFIKCRANLGKGGPSEQLPSPSTSTVGSSSETDTAHRQLVSCINLSQVLSQTPTHTPKYASIVDRIDRLTYRIKNLDPVSLTDEALMVLNELVASIKASLASSTGHQHSNSFNSNSSGG